MTDTPRTTTGQNPSTDEQPMHYFLLCGKIVFQILSEKEEGQATVEGIESVSLNAVLKQEAQNITVRSLGKAQQNLQMSFYRNLPDPSRVNVIEVVLESISSLGVMTQSEFRAGVEETSKEAENDQDVSVGVH